MEQLNLLNNKTKTEIALDFIREHEPEEGYFVGFSGGKDSVVVLDLVQRAGVKHQAYYSATGIDPPELVKFIREHYPYVISKRPNWKGHRSFYGMVVEKFPPTKFSRWCCDLLKKDPTKNIPLPHRIMGIRAEESAMRAKRSAYEYIKYLKQWHYKPIFNWLEWEIWDYIESENLPYCSLYDEGFHRLGCVICPFLCRNNQMELNRHRKRWPKYYAAFEKAMRRHWDGGASKRQIELGYAFTVEEFIDKWYHGNINAKQRNRDGKTAKKPA